MPQLVGAAVLLPINFGAQNYYFLTLLKVLATPQATNTSFLGQTISLPIRLAVIAVETSRIIHIYYTIYIYITKFTI